MIREAVDVEDSLGIEVDLVGTRSQIILGLVVQVAVGNHRLAALAERVDRAADFLQLGDARAVEAAEVEVQRTDALVVGRLLDRLDHVPQQGLGWLLAQELGDGALERVAAQLLDERPLRRDHQRRLVGHQWDRAGERGPQEPEDHQQQQQVQDLAQAVEPAPDPVQQFAHSAEHRRPLVGGAQPPRARSGARGDRRQTFSSMRAALPVRSRRK